MTTHLSPCTLSGYCSSVLQTFWLNPELYSEINTLKKL